MRLHLAFAAKAREMAVHHGLDQKVLDPDTIGFEDGAHNYVTTWSKQIAMATAQMFGCDLYQTRGARGRLVFVGREGDRVTADLMANYFVKSVQRLARRHVKNGGPTKGFTVACGLALAARIRAAAQRDHEAVEQSKRADRHMRTAMKLRGGSATRSVIIDRRAADAGRAAAKDIGLHRQTGHNRPLALTQR